LDTLRAAMERNSSAPVPSTSPSLATSRNLDVLRATAVLVVFTFHLLLFWGVTARGYGRFGVFMFFVHTSLVLMFSLDRQISENPKGGIFWPFMGRRCFRVYPLSALVVALVYLLDMPQTHVAEHSMTNPGLDAVGLVANLALVQDLVNRPSSPGVLWSLPLEMQMYLFLPLFHRLAKREGSRWSDGRALTVAAWLVAVGVAVVLHLCGYYGTVLAVAPMFLPGVVAYALYRRNVARLAPWVWLLGIGCAIAAYTLTESTPVAWAGCLALGVLAPHCRELDASVFTRVCSEIAKYSYGIYLFHLVSIWLAFMVLDDMPWYVQWSAFVVSAVALPVAGYHAVEKPMMDLGRRLLTARRPSAG